MLALQARRRLEEKQIANAKEVAAAVTKLAAAGEGSTLEAGQLELEAAQMEISVAQTDAEMAALRGELRPLLGMAPGESLAVTGELPDAAAPPRTEPEMKSRPDYQMAEAKAEAASLGVKAARASKWDDISVGVAAEVERKEDSPDGLETDTFVGVKFSLPLPLWNKNEGKIQAAEAAAQRAAKEIEALALRIRSESSAARAEMEASAAIVSRAADLLPKTAALEERFRKSYAAGQSTLTEILRVRDRRLALELSRLNALRDFHLARIRLQAALGH
jgi:cobalt-zinc-cadmium efflux system outer membrane protein